MAKANLSKLQSKGVFQYLSSYLGLEFYEVRENVSMDILINILKLGCRR